MSLVMAPKKSDDVFEVSGHLKEEYFKNLLIQANYNLKSSVSGLMTLYRKFKESYPTIADWFNEDLNIRLGHTNNRNLCFRNRIYIFTLAIHGLKLDYNYLFSLSGTDGFVRLNTRLNLDNGYKELTKSLVDIGYSEFASVTTVKWSFYRILMHTGKKHYREITIRDLQNFRAKAIEFCEDADLVKTLKGSQSNKDVKDRFTSSAYLLQKALYILNVVSQEPKKEHSRVKKIDRDLKHIKHTDIANTVVRYTNQCKSIKEENTIQNNFRAIHKFISWLEDTHPNIDNLSKLTRNVIEKYMLYLKENGSDKWGKPYSTNALVGYISPLKVFFDESLAWDYEDVPQKKIMFNYDLPKRPKGLPRYISDQDLKKLMESIKQLECPYQRNALILLRWTGARREEIQRLEVNALDYYNDGTPKLLIPIGKTNRSRWVPINKEAEESYKDLVEIRMDAGNVRGLIDRKTKKVTDYLFMKRNERISITYLFQEGLEEACTKSGLLTDEGNPKYTSHQFRHTIGTTMANKGASLTTIMKMLGHESPEMSLTYAKVHDETVKDEYQNSVDTNKEIAGGEFADTIKRNELKEDEVDWIKANFHKTYLIMGHCFHHKKEQMCDFADACYFCGKFVTTKEYIPTLRKKYETELELIKDAEEREWEKEIDRHKRVAERVKEILNDLGVEV